MILNSLLIKTKMEMEMGPIKERALVGRYKKLQEIRNLRQTYA